MIVFEILRKINRHVKRRKKMKAGRYLSPVRRIEQVYPLKDRRLCAMTFDDGPSALPPNPPIPNQGGKGLTAVLMETLSEHGAVGTFDCVGGTQENYPDKRGKLHTAKWGGMRHDHYPDYQQDHLAGILNQPELGREIIEKGHEMANHGGRHVLFGPMKLIYDSRESLSGLEAVLSDLTLFHNYAYATYGISPMLSRPPHYIDGIRGGFDAYDAYAHMGYQYMAASFDGGGWKPSCGDYSKDVGAMIAPMEKALVNDPNSLNGQIIFQKDGCNMSLQTPVASALGKQLELLKLSGYDVVSVSELVRQSPFEDYGEGMIHFEMARELVNAGFIIAYKNNSLQADRNLTFGELVTMTTPKDLYVALSKLKNLPLREDFNYDQWPLSDIGQAKVKIRTTHPYYWNFKYAKAMGYLNGISDDVDIDDLVDSSLLITYLQAVAEAHMAEVTGLSDEALLADEARNELILKISNEVKGMNQETFKRIDVIPAIYAILKNVKLM